MPGTQSEDNYIPQLPPETFLHIASYIDKPIDLISLGHTNSVFRSYAVAKLYSRICLYRWSAKTVEVLDHLIRYPDLASFVRTFEYRVWRQVDNPFGEEPSGRPYYEGLWGDPQQWSSVDELYSLQAAIPFPYMKAKLRQALFSMAKSLVTYIHVGYTLQFDTMLADILLTSPSLKALELSPCDVPNLHQRGQFKGVTYLKIRGDYRFPIHDVEGSFLEAFPNLDHFAGGESATMGALETLASPRLRTLEADMSRPVGQRVADLTTFLNHHPYLENVSLNLGRPPKSSLKINALPLKIQMEHLTSLNINFFTCISWSVLGEPDDAHLWLALLRKMPALERLQLYGWVWSTLTSLEKILDSLAPGVSLKQFSFTIRNINPDFMHLVAYRLPTLEYLEVATAEAKVKPHAHAWPGRQVCPLKSCADFELDYASALSPLKFLRTIMFSHNLGAAENDAEPRSPSPEELVAWNAREKVRLEATARLYAGFIRRLERVVMKQSAAVIFRDDDDNVALVTACCEMHD